MESTSFFIFTVIKNRYENKNTSILIILFTSNSLYSQTSFNKTQSIALPSGGGNAPYNIASGLIDNDAFPDIVVSTTLGNSVYWLKNDGSGVFTLQSTEISSTLNSAGGVAIADLNNDGFNDVVTTSYNDNRIVWFANDGSGIFTADTNPVSVNTKDYIFSVMAEDVDNDSSLDILVTDLTGSPSWFKRTQTAPGTATYTETILTTSIANPACLDLQDLDNDSQKDFVLSSASSGAGNDIVWFKNNGAGGFNSELVIDATQSQAYTFTFADFENDGDLDIASVAYNDDDVNVFNNQKIVLSADDSAIRLFKIYPNPTSNKLHFSGLTSENFTVSVYDLLGKKIMNLSQIANSALDISELQAGIYIIKFEGFNTTYKFIKK
ncbi:MAG: hypothetical protein ACI83H_000320 [Glaciecola sp.]